LFSVFFFFKQKTAYEISRDWSSDVCSSDLWFEMGCGGVRQLYGAVRCLDRTRSMIVRSSGGPNSAQGANASQQRKSHRRSLTLEIGRASCRERWEIERWGEPGRKERYGAER